MSVYQKEKGGPWYVRYWHGGKEYRVAGGKSQKQAEAKEIRIKAELQAGADPLSLTAGRSFLELADAFLQDPDVVRLAWFERVNTIVKRLAGHFGTAKLAGVNPNLISRYKAARLERDPETGATEIKESTLNRELAVLRRMLRWGAEHGYLHKSRVPPIRLAPEDHKIVFLTRDDEKALLGACQPWLRDLAILGLDTGCRLGELLDLTWGQVDLAAGTIRVRTEKKRKSETRTLFMTPRVRALLAEMPRGLPDVKVFRHLTGEHQVSSVGQTMRRAVKRAKLSDNVTFHALRHTFATRQVERGTNILVLKEMLGHSSLAMVQRYGHVSQDDIRRAMLGIRPGDEGVRDKEVTGYETGYVADPEVVQS